MTHVLIVLPFFFLSRRLYLGHQPRLVGGRRAVPVPGGRGRGRGTNPVQVRHSHGPRATGGAGDLPPGKVPEDGGGERGGAAVRVQGWQAGQ